MGDVPFKGRPSRRGGAAAPLAVSDEHSIFVDKAGRLHTCGCDGDEGDHLLGHALDPDADSDDPREIGPPTPVPSMNDRRIISENLTETLPTYLLLSRDELLCSGEHRDRMGKVHPKIPCEGRSIATSLPAPWGAAGVHAG